MSNVIQLLCDEPRIAVLVSVAPTRLKQSSSSDRSSQLIVWASVILVSTPIPIIRDHGHLRLLEGHYHHSHRLAFCPRLFEPPVKRHLSILVELGYWFAPANKAMSLLDTVGCPSLIPVVSNSITPAYPTSRNSINSKWLKTILISRHYHDYHITGKHGTQLNSFSSTFSHSSSSKLTRIRSRSIRAFCLLPDLLLPLS